MTSPLVDQTLAIIGGTGRSGKWAVKAAVQRGGKVRVLCRNPDKLRGVYESLWNKEGTMPQNLAYDKVAESGQLVVVKGSLPTGKTGDKFDSSNDFAATDEQMASLKELVTGTTHVMSFLGMDPKNKAAVCRPGIEAIMRAVNECGMAEKPKIIIMSSIILKDSYAQGKAAWGSCGCIGYFMRWSFLRDVFDDMEAAEEYALENRTKMSLNVTLLRATVLGDKKNYYVDYSISGQPTYYMAKADELKKVKMNIDRQHVVECFMDAAADKEGKFSNCEWSLFDA